jgi:hypothetical protein
LMFGRAADQPIDRVHPESDRFHVERGDGAPQRVGPPRAPGRAAVRRASPSTVAAAQSSFSSAGAVRSDINGLPIPRSSNSAIVQILP